MLDWDVRKRIIEMLKLFSLADYIEFEVTHIQLNKYSLVIFPSMGFRFQKTHGQVHSSMLGLEVYAVDSFGFKGYLNICWFYDIDGKK